jgi:hypothetical protein
MRSAPCFTALSNGHRLWDQRLSLRPSQNRKTALCHTGQGRCPAPRCAPAPGEGLIGRVDGHVEVHQPCMLNRIPSAISSPALRTGIMSPSFFGDDPTRFTCCGSPREPCAHRSSGSRFFSNNLKFRRQVISDALNNVMVGGQVFEFMWPYLVLFRSLRGSEDALGQDRSGGLIAVLSALVTWSERASITLTQHSHSRSSAL